MNSSSPLFPLMIDKLSTSTTLEMLRNNWASEASPTLGSSIEISRDISECGSTLYVGLARAVPPANTNFRLTFLLTRLQEALYEDLPV